MKKIGLDARMYGVEQTGIGVYIKNLTDQLFLIDQKNEYTLFMLEPAYSSFQPPSQRVKKIKVACPWYSFSEQLKLPPILLKYNLNTPSLDGEEKLLFLYIIDPKIPSDRRPAWLFSCASVSANGS